jgi:hypothetical protein
LRVIHGRACHFALTDPRQLFADEHVHDATAAKASLHYHASRATVSHLADLGGALAQRM